MLLKGEEESHPGIMGVLSWKPILSREDWLLGSQRLITYWSTPCDNSEVDVRTSYFCYNFLFYIINFIELMKWYVCVQKVKRGNTKVKVEMTLNIKSHKNIKNKVQLYICGSKYCNYQYNPRNDNTRTSSEFPYFDVCMI